MITDLSKELSLDEKEEAEISLLYVAHFEEVKDAMKSGRPSHEKMEALKTEFETEVKDNLTDAQVTKYEAFLNNASAQNHGHRPGGR